MKSITDIPKIFKWVSDNEEKAVELQTLLTSIPAMAPENGGDGELAKAEALILWLKQHGIEPAGRDDAPDKRAAGNKRPNFWIEIPGKNRKKRLWIMSHLDVVPPGNSALWSSPPFECIRQGGKLKGRGTEDNQQGLISSVLCFMALKEFSIIPPVSLRLLFVSDEEIASEYGIQYFLRRGIIKADDVFIIPDAGNDEGTLIEISEKSILWFKFIVKGLQCHASEPHKGKNTFTASSALVIALDQMHKMFPLNDGLFTPSYSTFVPTKKEGNVDNINTIPGEDIFYMDCRILPEIDLEKVETCVSDICTETAVKYGVEIHYEVLDKVQSQSSSGNTELSAALKQAVFLVKKKEAFFAGFGGGTVAAYLRNFGCDAYVWSTLNGTAHMPDEYCSLENLTSDAKVLCAAVLRMQ